MIYLLGKMWEEDGVDNVVSLKSHFIDQIKHFRLSYINFPSPTYFLCCPEYPQI